MTVTKERGRRRGRSRSRVPDPLPQPEAIEREVRKIVVRLRVLNAVYGLEHDALAMIGSSEVSVATSPGKPTEFAWSDEENELARARCREAVNFVRRAATNVEDALLVFGPDATQPGEPSPDSVVDRPRFNRALHRQREEEQRR